MEQKKLVKEKDFYYLTIYKIKGHTRWRSYLSRFNDIHHIEINGACEITDSQVFQIDKVKGTLKLIG